VFLPVSTGTKSIKNRPRNAGVIIKNKVARFLWLTVYMFVRESKFSISGLVNFTISLFKADETSDVVCVQVSSESINCTVTDVSMTKYVVADSAVADGVMCSGSSSNLSETDSRSSSTAAAGGSSSRKRSRKDTNSGKSSSHDCRRLSLRIVKALRKPKSNVSDSENVGKDDTKDEAETVT